MNRINRRYLNLVQQNSIQPRTRCLDFFYASVFVLLITAPAQAGSVSASLQITARVVSSCRVSTDALQSVGNVASGSFSCPTNGAPLTSSNTAAYGESANYTLSDVPGTDGAVKMLTLNF